MDIPGCTYVRSSGFGEVITAAQQLVSACPSACARACVDCLLRFRNASFHKHLNRRMAAEKIAQWGDSIVLSHPIPPNLPKATTAAAEMPADKAEALLKHMLKEAGFPEPTWHYQVQLGRPLGSTSPDCYFADENPNDPGVCIYLDGLSRHIHGNPQTREKDRAIRSELRARRHQVIEIAASDLYDQQRMAEHFYRLGMVLLGKTEAKRVRENPTWYRPPE